MEKTIYTLTLNPSVDYSFYVKDIKFDDINRIEYQKVHPGGKGVNIARMLFKLDEKPVPVTFLSRERSKIYNSLLKKEGLRPVFIKIEDEIRNVYNFVSKRGEILRFNEKGPKIKKEEKASLFEKIERLNLKSNDIFAISGSIPDGFEKDIYRKIVERLKKLSVTTVIDADGEILRHAIEASPSIIKPNLWELERATGKKIKNGKELIEIVSGILKKGIMAVIITLGEKGAILFSENKKFYGKGPRVRIKSSVGCGDAFVAGFLYNFKRVRDYADCLKLAVACGTAKVECEWTEMPDRKKVELIYKKTTVFEVDSDWILHNLPLKTER